MAAATPVVLALEGELDLASAPQLRLRLLAGLVEARTSGSSLVAVDLSHVVFMDAASLGMIATAADRCEQEGRVLRVYNANSVQSRMFRLFGLDHLLASITARIPPQAAGG